MMDYLKYLLLFTALFAMHYPVAAQPERTVQILYTNNTNGFLDACTCSEKSLGGLARRAAVIQTHRNSNTLLVDGGNLFSPYKKNPAQEKFVAALISEMTYDAINLSEFDFTYGYKFWQDAAKALPTVSNLLGSKHGEFITETVRVVTKDSLRLAVIGFIDESAVAELNPVTKKELTIRPMEKSLATFLSFLKAEKKADVIVLLLKTYTYTIEKTLAEKFPDIDVILTSTETFEVHKVFGKTIVASAGHDGEKVGKMTLAFDATTKKLRLVKNDLIDLAPTLMPDAAMQTRIKQFQASQIKAEQTKH
jgi:2',3'-cyclic-nucleotide 2'-phosphodiesterase (5'-nucleotidase family)